MTVQTLEPPCLPVMMSVQRRGHGAANLAARQAVQTKQRIADKIDPFAEMRHRESKARVRDCHYAMDSTRWRDSLPAKGSRSSRPRRRSSATATPASALLIVAMRSSRDVGWVVRTTCARIARASHKSRFSVPASAAREAITGFRARSRVMLFGEPRFTFISDLFAAASHDLTR